MSILVVNKKTHKPCAHDYYIGRPSPLGNPYSHLALAHTTKVESREMAVRGYERWLRENLENTTVRDKMAWLLRQYQEGKTIHLVCWCAPLACHGDVIKKKIEDMATVINLYKGEANDQ